MDISVKAQLSPDARALVAVLGTKGRGGWGARAATLVAKLPASAQTVFSRAAAEISAKDASLVSLIASLNADEALEDILANCVVASWPEDNRKQRGAVFTPYWLAARVAANAQKWWSKLHGTARPGCLGDVSCGAGAFLAASTLFSARATIGLDIDDRSIAYAALLAVARRQKWRLECADTLKKYAAQGNLFAGKTVAPTKFDVLLGNPPYVRSANLDPAYAEFVKSNYKSFSLGNADLSVAFIEHAIDQLNDGGIFSYLISSKFSQSNYGTAICKRLASDVRVLEIEHFADHQLFKGYTTYVMCLTAAKLKPAKRFTLTTFPSGLPKGADPGTGESVTVASAQLVTPPWGFVSGGQLDILSCLQNARNPAITDVFGDIFQGVRTGANDVFVLNSLQAAKAEQELLLPYVTGRQIGRFSVDRESLRLIYPYEANAFGQHTLLNATAFRSRFPRTWARLLQAKAALQERSTDHSARSWYAYSRSQNLGGHRVRKLLVKEMMARAEFAADFEGDVAFGSGYALDASKLTKSELQLWVAVLNTPTLEFALRNAGTQLHSGWFRLLKHHLKRVRLPRFKAKALARAKSLAAKLHNVSIEEERDTLLLELDQIVAEAFGLSRQQRAVISIALSDAHKRSRRSDSDISRSKDDLELPSEVGGPPSHPADQYEPVKLEQYVPFHRERSDLHHFVTAKHNKSLPRHRWYAYTQGYSAGLVEALLSDFAPAKKGRVLDPFTGGGTTNLVCAQMGYSSVGVDVSPLMCWVARTKLHHYHQVELQDAIDRFDYGKAVRLGKTVPSGELFQNYFGNAYTPRILAQLRATFQYLKGLEVTEKVRDFLTLGAVSLLEEVSQIRKHGSHYRFLNKTESIGLRKLNIPTISDDADFGELLRKRHLMMLDDVSVGPSVELSAKTEIIEGDARNLSLPTGSVDAIITSPPYLNRNNYIAQQKAELSMLGLVQDYAHYRALVRSTFRSHVESRLDRHADSEFEEVRRILHAIKLEPGNNAKIPHMIAGYFADLAQTMQELHRVSRKGARGAFVVGNTRWGGVVIPIDHLLMMMAERAGFTPERILVTRLKGNSPQQMRKYGRIPVRESIVIFRKS